MKRIKAKIFVFIVMMLAFISYNYTDTAYAGTVQGSKAVTGTVNLFKDITSALLIIVPVAAVAIIVFLLLKMTVSTENEENKPHKKQIKNVIIVAVAAELVSALLTIIISYYV